MQNSEEQKQKPTRVEYINYEAPTLLDTEAIARPRASCGVCITGGSAPHFEREATQEEQGESSAPPAQ